MSAPSPRTSHERGQRARAAESARSRGRDPRGARRRGRDPGLDLAGHVLLSTPAALDRSLLDQPAETVAPLLLGAILSRRGEDGVVSVRLTEVEAYSGEGLDPGSHAHRGRSPRTSVMFGPSGHLYTYFTYGMHVCANVVCHPEGHAGGILFRAGEVIEGVELARTRRTTSRKDSDLAQGPARLAVALGIELADYGLDLFSEGSPVRLTLPAEPLPADRIGVGPRTGIASPEGAGIPWRFWELGDVTVSPYKAHVPKRRR